MTLTTKVTLTSAGHCDCWIPLFSPALFPIVSRVNHIQPGSTMHSSSARTVIFFLFFFFFPSPFVAFIDWIISIDRFPFTFTDPASDTTSMTYARIFM